jgi:hypothetical protein
LATSRGSNLSSYTTRKGKLMRETQLATHRAKAKARKQKKLALKKLTKKGK